MKHIKLFEEITDTDIEYSVGDIVVCITPEFAPIGTKFRVIKIYKYEHTDVGDFPDKIEVDFITSDQINDKKYFVLVIQLNTNNQHSGVKASRFRKEEKAELMIATNKYNL